ncbi:AccI family restriction endonuclease [Chlorobaculum sp. 24CR]|nr:AccI family restriction endonuclease [Chlorobaculum sp. 24CR]
MYKKKILELIQTLDFGIDPDIKIGGRPPTMASSEFLTNKEQGDWAENIVQSAINENDLGLLAVQYGRSESLAAGDEGFEAFYASYQDELNEIGKRPDILVFERSKFPTGVPDTLSDEIVSSAIAAIEVRSSSFLADRYAEYMEQRANNALAACSRIKEDILEGDLADLLFAKNEELHRFLMSANNESFKQLDFRRPSWSSSAQLRQLSDFLRELKNNIEILHKRDHLSITPKVEDIALVNRWIQRFGVTHYYLQVFFDKAYLIPFEQILEIAADSEKEGELFSVERDVKNQGKTTIKINVQVGREVIGKIDMPDHQSQMKELGRGRLLFYVTFSGGRGYLDGELLKEVLNVD